MTNRLLILLMILFIGITSSCGMEQLQKDSSFIKELPELTNINCRFKQEKHLKNINKLIISGGDFSFDKNKGVVFKTKYPIKSVVYYNNYDYKELNDIMNAISTKNYSVIQKVFDIYFEKNNNKWVLKLLPKQKTQVCDIISFISISGDKNINKIVISMLNGNKTVLWFLTN